MKTPVPERSPSPLRWPGSFINKILVGDCVESMRKLPAGAVHCCVTSPPYWGLRDYGVDGQMGLEKTPQEYVEKMVGVFREVRRVLRDDGTLWINLGDSYANDGKWGGSSGGKNTASGSERLRTSTGLKPKDLCGMPWRVAFALQSDGWYLRSNIIWHKPNPMPESVTDRPTNAHEYLFLLTKQQKYFYDAEAIKEKTITEGDNRAERTDRTQTEGRGGDEPRKRTGNPTMEIRNKRSVWTVPTQPYSEAHFATFPPKLIEPCVLAGCPKGGVVLDPFMGAGTTALVAAKHSRDFIGCELNPEYAEIARKRIKNEMAQGKLFLS